VLAATNRDLEREVRAGRFRPDLFHRLNVYPLQVPPLRQRAEDVPLLAGYFCDLARRRLGLGPVRLSPEALDALRAYPWPGNVRELDNVLSRVTLRAAAKVVRGDVILLAPADLGPDFSGARNGVPSTPSTPEPERTPRARYAKRRSTSSGRQFAARWPRTTAAGPPPPAPSACTAATSITSPNVWGCAEVARRPTTRRGVTATGFAACSSDRHRRGRRSTAPPRPG
jgi:transcriptional regulator with AAA-type ATPase domain